MLAARRGALPTGVRPSTSSTGRIGQGDEHCPHAEFSRQPAAADVVGGALAWPRRT